VPDAAVLDDPEARARLDAGGMAKAVRELPEQCREAWNEARRLELPPSYREIERIVILGMGGSAIAGDVFRLLLARECPVPVLNHRHYDLPPYVDARTLLIASSFSGDTEETVSAFEQGLATPAKKLAITTGGRLLTTARANGIPAFVFRYRGDGGATGAHRGRRAAGREPREAVGGPAGRSPARGLRRRSADGSRSPLENPDQRVLQGLGVLRRAAGGEPQRHRVLRPAAGGGPPRLPRLSPEPP